MERFMTWKIKCIVEDKILFEQMKDMLKQLKDECYNVNDIEEESTNQGEEDRVEHVFMNYSQEVENKHLQIRWKGIEFDSA